MRRNHYSPRWLVNQCAIKKNIPNGPQVAPGSADKVARLGQEDEGGDDVSNSNDLSFGVEQVAGTRELEEDTLSSKSARCYRFTKKSNFNQILEVLLPIVLVNFLVYRLTHLPLAWAAFGNGQRHQARDYRSHYPVPFSGEDEERSFLRFDDADDAYFRQSHSIAGSAFGYNGLQLQHNLDDNLLRSQNFKISPKPCTVGRIEGTCMFVWECIKSEGRHVGMCVDSFMFGSCCAHNYTDNIVLPNTFSYTRPTKPLGMGSMNHRPRPPSHPHRPSISGMTTIERPHGAGTLVIRPSGPHHQGSLFKPQHLKPAHGSSFGSTSSTTTTSITTTTTTDDPTKLWTSNSVLGDLVSSASIAAATTVNHQQHWHLTTEPNFITKPRPPAWDKPVTLRPKPSKPTKKPSTTLGWFSSHQQQQQQHVTTSHISPSFSPYTTRKPTKRPATVSSPYYTPTTGKTTTSTSATTTIITTPPTSSHHTRPQVFGQNTKPITHLQPSTTRPYTKPPTSSISASTATTTTTTTTTLGTTSSLAAAAAAAAVVASTSKPSTTTSSHTKKPTTTTTTTTSATGVLPTKTTTKRPTTIATSSVWPSSSSSSTTTTSAIAALASSSASSSSSSSSSLLSSSSLAPTTTLSNISSIESNEISDNLDGPSATIKTISAARSECGVPVLTRPETRIVGGKSAAFGRWPWQVSVRRTSFFGFSSTHRCGGALINENWIATAGHCVDDLLISQIRIRVGEYDFSHVQEQLPYIERGVAKKVVHPQYNFFTYEYDLALVKLEQPLEFAPHVSPICLPQTNSLLIGMNATVTGWGRLSEGGTLPSVLQEVSVPIVSNDNCKSMFLRAGRQEFIPEIFLCAGYETGGQDSCQGDSGGPLQVKSQDGRYFLAGIISWGIGCAEANLPGVCTRISKFVPWIMENVT